MGGSEEHFLVLSTSVVDTSPDLLHPWRLRPNHSCGTISGVGEGPDCTCHHVQPVTGFRGSTLLFTSDFRLDVDYMVRIGCPCPDEDRSLPGKFFRYVSMICLTVEGTYLELGVRLTKFITGDWSLSDMRVWLMYGRVVPLGTGDSCGL